MFQVFNCLTTEHDLRLVVVAGLVCFLASVTAVNMFNRARSIQSRSRVVWLVAAGAATGCGVWATHFIAMLAYNPGVAVGYDVNLTGLSLLVAAAITGLGLAVAAYRPVRWGAVLGGAIFGGGVACMHYLGMSALELPGHIRWSIGLVLASIVIGMLLGAVALLVAVRDDRKSSIFWGALLLTLAIVSHHFTAMGAVEIVADPARTIAPLALSPTALAVVVASAAMAILALSLGSAFADRRLDEKGTLLEIALNNMTQGVVMYDSHDRLVVCNERYVQMYGLSRDVMKPGCKLRDAIRHRIEAGNLDRDPDTFRDMLVAMMRDGKTFERVAEEKGRVIAVVDRPINNGQY